MIKIHFQNGKPLMTSQGGGAPVPLLLTKADDTLTLAPDDTLRCDLGEALQKDRRKGWNVLKCGCNGFHVVF